MSQDTPRRLKALVGRAERVSFPIADITGVPAKIDTGAFRSSVWASDIYVKDGKLHYKLLGPESPFYSGRECITEDFETVEVENSFGHKENRYSIHIRIKLGSKTTKSNFTLADRSQKTYPVLIGRKLLRGRYIVDVSEGQPIYDEETSE